MSTVVRIHSSLASSWDFGTGYYWQNVDQAIVDQMVAEAVKTLTGEATANLAWQSLMNYVPHENVGIEINGNDFEPFYMSELSYLNTLPQVILAIAKGLIASGVPETNIFIMELTGGGRRFYSYYNTIIQAELPNVHFIDNGGAGFGANPELYVSGIGQSICDTIFEMHHLILVPLLKAIAPVWGITGAIKLMQGIIENPGGTRSELASLDNNPNVLIYQNSHVRDKVRVILADGIFGNFSGGHFGENAWYAPWNDPQQYTTEIPKRWLTFNNEATNVIFAATDPVALDQKLLDHVAAERTVRGLQVLPDVQIEAGHRAGIGSRTGINYLEVELEEEPPPPPPPPGQGTLIVNTVPSGKEVVVVKL